MRLRKGGLKLRRRVKGRGEIGASEVSDGWPINSLGGTLGGDWPSGEIHQREK